MELEISSLSNAEAWHRTGINGIMFRFPNRYGASIVHHAGSYGIELAVIEFATDGRDSWKIVYDTPITDDVIGWLDRDGAVALLRQISELPARRVAIDAG